MYTIYFFLIQIIAFHDDRVKMRLNTVIMFSFLLI